VCDVIPITIKAPPSGEQEGFVRISISWEAEREPTGATSLATNDLDIYLWNDPPGDQTATSTPDDPDTDEDESEDNNPAASGNNPERLNLFVTEETEYLMVVSNFAGRNAGYTVEYRYFGADHAPPSVVGGLGAPAAPSGTTSSGDLVGSLVRPDGANPPAPFTPTPAALPALPEAAVESDGDFAAFDGLDLDEELAAPKDVAAFTRHVRDAARLGDPSAMALLAWLGLVPAALFGGLGFFLWRRRPVALRVAVSSGSR
jgi:LPXTG-motif cell wall-anchored protein